MPKLTRKKLTAEEKRLKINAYNRQWRAEWLKEISKDPIKLAAHKVKEADKARVRRNKDRVGYNAKAREFHAVYRAANPDKVKRWKRDEGIRNRDKQRALKRQMLDLYGKVCFCCGEDRFEFLGIDHKDGGGGKERKGKGGNYYKWLSKQAKREDLRTCCHNCNQSMGYYGYCPHDLDRTANRLAVFAFTCGIKPEEFDSVPETRIPWPKGTPWSQVNKANHVP